VRTATLLITCLIAGGCATAPRPRTASLPPGEYIEASASALAFEPPIAEGAPHPELARGPRAPAAFFGFQESTAEYYTSATANLQTTDFGDSYIQESISVKSGVRYR
jgi:hypothetical protein